MAPGGGVYFGEKRTYVMDLLDRIRAVPGGSALVFGFDVFFDVFWGDFRVWVWCLLCRVLLVLLYLGSRVFRGG